MSKPPIRLPVTHAQALAACDGLARLGGYTVFGVRRAMRGADGAWCTPYEGDGEGFPDRLYLRPAGAIVRGETCQSDSIITVEMKVGKDKLRKKQRAWDDYLSRFRHIRNAVFHWPEEEASARRLLLAVNE